MTVLPLLAVGILMKFAAVLFVLVALVLILVVLMQKGRGGGLSGAFAGGMASGLLGSKTGDFLTWVTIVLVSVFLVLAVVMARFYRPPVRYGRGLPPAAQQPLTGGQSTAPQPGATGQPTPASQPTPAQPSTSGTGAQPTPSAPGADTGKSGGQ